MPIYEYVCNDCGATTELRMSVAEKTKSSKVECQKCGSQSVRQVFGGVGMLVGGKFYPDDGGGCCGPGCGC